jgi:hypothetical protein
MLFPPSYIYRLLRIYCKTSRKIRFGSISGATIATVSRKSDTGDSRNNALRNHSNSMIPNISNINVHFAAAEKRARQEFLTP